MAPTRLELGRFLIERLNKEDEGRALLASAINYYIEMNLPGKEEASIIARKLDVLF